MEGSFAVNAEGEVALGADAHRRVPFYHCRALALQPRAMEVGVRNIELVNEQWVLKIIH